MCVQLHVFAKSEWKQHERHFNQMKIAYIRLITNLFIFKLIHTSIYIFRLQSTIVHRRIHLLVDTWWLIFITTFFPLPYCEISVPFHSTTKQPKNCISYSGQSIYGHWPHHSYASVFYYFLWILAHKLNHAQIFTQLEIGFGHWTTENLYIYL